MKTVDLEKKFNATEEELDNLPKVQFSESLA